MMFQILLFSLTAISGILADCTGTIHVEGVSSTYGNDVANGEYQLSPVGECNGRDIFQKGTEEMYLYHINNAVRGYWIFRNFYLCTDNSEDQGYVRANDLEYNPGLIQGAWEEKISDNNWDKVLGIDVDCIPIAKRAEEDKISPVNSADNDANAKDAVKDRAHVMNVSMGANKPGGATMSVLMVVMALRRLLL